MFNKRKRLDRMSPIVSKSNETYKTFFYKLFNKDRRTSYAVESNKKIRFFKSQDKAESFFKKAARKIRDRGKY